MLAVAAGGFHGSLSVAGGVDLVSDGPDGKARRRYLKDAFRYDAGRGWRRIADLPRAMAAAPSHAPIDRGGFFILGGDDGSQVAAPPERHRGFHRDILRYDAGTDRWGTVAEIPAPRVTTPCVFWHASWVVPTGEARPGVRSPEVWRLTPDAKDARLGS